MKPRFHSHRSLLAAASALRSFLLGGSVLATATSLHAADRYWDGTDTSANADGGAGTWNAANTNWDTLATGGANTTFTTGADTAVFVGAAGTVTLGATRTAAGLSFNTGGTVISASSTNFLTIGSGGISVGASAGSGNQIGTGTTNTGYVSLSATQEWINNSANIFFARDGEVTLGSNTLTLSGSGQISLASTTNGSGNIVVSSGATVSMSGNNNYSGTTTIYGTLTINSLTNHSAASGLGDKASNASSNLVIDGGTLRVQVENGTSDRVFTMGANGATLEARLTGVNSGRIQLTNTAAIAYSGVGDRSLALGGNSDDTSSSIALAIGDVGGGNGIVSLVKNEAHNWTVSGTNTYSGGTTVNQGTLTMGSASALGSSSGQLTVNGGTLNMAANSLTVGNLSGTGGVISGTSGTRLLTIGQGDTGGGNFQGQINNGAGGSTALTKTGSGTITLSGTNGYTGATSVNGGQLVVTGAISSSSGVTVKDLAILAGESSDAGATNGKVSAITLNGGDATRGILAPGNGTAGDKGTLYGTSLAWTGATTAGNSQMVFDLGAINTNDKLVLSGAMTKGSGSIFEWDFGGTALFGTTYTLVTAAGGFGTFADTDFSWKAGSLGAGLTVGTFSITGTSLTFTAIPEPSTALGGLLLTAGLFRRRRTQDRPILSLES